MESKSWTARFSSQKQDIIYLECFFREENRRTHYALQVSPEKRQELEAAISAGGDIQLEEYGEILKSAWGPLPIRYEDMPLDAA